MANSGSEIIIITIDGPAGSGKSTVAAKLAKKLGFLYINQGALFRAIGLKAARVGVDPADESTMVDLAKRTEFRFSAEDSSVLIVDGVEFAAELRTAEAGELASHVAVLPKLRDALLEAQREIAATNSVVVEGRDAGSVGFPQAQLKVYLDADITVRAARRFEELKQTNSLGGRSLEQLSAEMEARDNRDRSRKVSPLTQPADAVVLDTTEMSPDEVLDELVEILSSRTSVEK